MAEPYNPLDRVNLARSVELTLLQQPPHRLPLDATFSGAGVYALYYQGDHPLYERIASPEHGVPIYVGKAVPAGSRKGLVDLSAAVGPVLFNRIGDHAESIQAASDLQLEDFVCRYLVVEDIFIALAEAALIQHFRPLWNVHVSGFGLHDPGARRYGGDRSEWDELHPGRRWYQHMRQVRTPDEIAERVRNAYAQRDTATIETLPETAPPTVEMEEDEQEGE